MCDVVQRQLQKDSSEIFLMSYLFDLLYCDIIMPDKKNLSFKTKICFIHILNSRFCQLSEIAAQQVNQKRNLLFCFLSGWLIIASANSSLEAVVPLRPSSPLMGGWYFHLRLRRGANPWQLCPSGTISVALLVVWHNGLPSFCPWNCFN